MDVGHAGFDKSTKLELRAAFADLNGTNLAGPVIDILEQVMMNGLQVVEVEGAGGDAFGYTLCRHAPFHPIGLSGVGYSEMVPENMRSRIDIPIAQTHKVF